MKSFYKSILLIAIPISVQGFISFLVTLVDTLMVGRLGEDALSGVNLASQLFFIIMVICAGIAEGANILIAQFYGKSDIKSIKKIFPLIFRIAIVLSVISLCIGVFIPEIFMKIYANANDTELILLGSEYLYVLAFSFPFFIMSEILIKTQRSIGNAKISLFIYPVSLLANIIFNYMFIFGKFGAPALGVAGAGLSTVIARFIEFIMAVFFVFRIDKKIALCFSDLKKVDKNIIPKFIKNSVPILINDILWVLGSTFITIIFGKLGSSVVAGNAVSSVVFQMVSVLLFGVASSALVITGNTIGMGEMDKTYKQGNIFVVLSAIIGIVACVTVILTRGFMVDVYNFEVATKQIALDILLANAVILLFQTIGIITGIGVLRGGGDGKFVLYTEIICVWCIAIPLGLLGAFVWNVPIFWVYIFTRIDEIIKAFAFSYRIFKTKWALDITI